MKVKLIFLFTIAFLNVKAQIANLSQLSKGVFYDSEVIKDANNNIKGYFLLFEKDKVAKETFELEYVVLDENLTKVTSGFITEMRFQSFLIDAQRIKIKVSLHKNILLIQLSDDFGQVLGFETQDIQAYSRYRTLDLTNNKLSNNFLFNKGNFKFNPTFDRKLGNYENNASQNINFYNEIGLVVQSNSLYSKNELEKDFFAKYDENYTQLWKYDFEPNVGKNLMKIGTYLNSDKDVIIIQNHMYKKLSSINEKSITILDAKNGKIINDFVFPELELYSYRVINTLFKTNHIEIVGNYSKKTKTGFVDDYEDIGIFSFKLDKITGKLLDSKFLKWENAGSKIDIDKKGNVKNEGFLYIHNFITLSDDKMIAICEAYKQSPITTNNLYFIELSKDFQINQVFVIEKFRNKFPKTAAYTATIKSNGLFDFMDYQKMNDDEYLFYYNDNEKNSKNRKKSTLYGVVSYVDGKFQKQTLNLKTETSTIKAYPAKKGYLMLIEDFDLKDKPNEFRLEKINY